MDGTPTLPPGSLSPAGETRARFRVVPELRDGLIHRRGSCDCFDSR